MEKKLNDCTKVFNGFTHSKINITAPLPLKTDMNYRDLTLIAGHNNTSKSFMNKLVWASTFFFNLKIIESLTNVKEDKTDLEKFQFILDNTFVYNNLDGELEFVLRDKLLNVAFFKFAFNIENGKVTNLIIDFSKDSTPMGSVIYLSKEARDFNNIERYLKIKKMLQLEDITSFSDLEKLGEFHKVHDIIAIESLLLKLKNINPILTTLKQFGTEKLLDGVDLTTIEYNKEKSELYYITSKEEKRRLSTLGTGTQSIILMLLSSVSN